MLVELIGQGSTSLGNVKLTCGNKKKMPANVDQEFQKELGDYVWRINETPKINFGNYF
jgi:hypothetical protein